MFLCNGGKGYRGEFVYIRDDREARVGVEYFSLCEVRVFGLQGESAIVPQKVPSEGSYTEKAPTRAFSWLKAATTAFTFKTLLRHYAKWALTPQSLNVKLGPRRKGHKGRAVWLA